MQSSVWGFRIAILVASIPVYEGSKFESWVSGVWGFGISCFRLFGGLLSASRVAVFSVGLR